MRFFVFLLCLVCWILASDRQAAAQPTAVFQTVFTAITAPQSSGPIRNQGQSMHLLYVFFPGQTTTQAGLAVRLEASFDNVIYFPISADITQATNVGGQVYNIVAAFGAWPYVRVRNNATAPAAMTVRYAGHTLPVVGLIQTETDRFLL